MVDPNRKINRLTEKDIEFLEECEREFSSRFTEDDPEFMKYCSKPLDDPPIIENWSTSGGDFSRNRNQRNWRHNFRHRGGGRANYNDRSNITTTFKRGDTRHRPIDIRRNYNNFVAASKDD